MTFSELKSKTFREVFVEGIPENLLTAYENGNPAPGILDSFIVEALFDIQRAVPCFTTPHSDTFPHCASYFNCGLTVLPKPAGQINRVYVIDRINPETGLEDPTASADYCTKVFYQQVDFCTLQSYMRLCERCSGNSVAAVADALVTNFFGVWRRKRSYPRPSQSGLEALPTLPQGFLYPTESTNAGGRSPSGVWANHRGRIYIAPWIESTETVVIEWSGIKRNWSGTDLVEDDPKFRQAVRLHVQVQHEQSFGDDPGKLHRLKYALYGGPDEAGAIPLLIHECNEQNRIKRCQESGAAGMAGFARGIGVNTNPSSAFTNDQRIDYTAACPSGKTGNSVRVVIEPGEVGSALSVADANARASQQAADDANARLVCTDAATVYHNTNAGQPYTAYCPSGFINDEGNEVPPAEGSPSTVLRGEYTSTISEQAANDQADEDAQEAAEAGLHCTFWNAFQTYTATCPEDDGPEVTETTEARTFSSTDSQAAADALALADAKKRAEQALLCSGDSPQVYYSTAFTINRQRTCQSQTGCTYIFELVLNVSPGRGTSTTSQADAQNQAMSYAVPVGNNWVRNEPCPNTTGCQRITQNRNI